MTVTRRREVVSLVDRATVERWLERYVEAWRTYEHADIVALFSSDARYRYDPYDKPVVGNDAIARSWVEPSRKDDPGTYDPDYHVIAVDGDVAVATGHTHYFDADGNVDRTYDNCFIMRFTPEGLCREFTEFYMKRP